MAIKNLIGVIFVSIVFRFFEFVKRTYLSIYF